CFSLCYSGGAFIHVGSHWLTSGYFLYSSRSPRRFPLRLARFSWVATPTCPSQFSSWFLSPLHGIRPRSDRTLQPTATGCTFAFFMTRIVQEIFNHAADSRG